MNGQAGKQGLVWGSLLIIFGIVGLMEIYITLSPWAWVALLAVAGLAVFGVFLMERSEWGLLIPAYALWAVAGLIALTTLNALRDGLVATYVLTTIALPFLVVFARDRQKWWALIPAYVLLVVGLMVALIEGGILDDLLIPAYVMFAIAIPFFVIYACRPKQWWPLIPGGILAIIGLSFLIAEAAVQYLVPVLLILAGGWILARQFMRREVADALPPTSPETERTVSELENTNTSID